MLGLLCVLSFNVVSACRRRRVAELYVESWLRVVLVKLIGEASPEDEERLFTMDDCHTHRKPVHTFIPLMPTTGT